MSSAARAQLLKLYQVATDCRGTMERFIAALPPAELDKARNVEVTSATVAGLSGTATIAGGNQSIPLLKEQGRWKIAGFRGQTR